MNIQKNILKIASGLADEMIKSFEMTEEEWKKYSEAHPNAKRENHTIVQKKSENGNGSKKVEMTDEQKKLHELAINSGRNFNRKESIARDRKTHPITLDMLANGPDEYDGVYYGVHSSVASNPNTHPKTLHKLRLDENNATRYNVARNKNTSPDTLDELIKDKKDFVRREVAFNKNTSPETLKKLSEDYSLMVKFAVAYNKNTPEETIKQLSEHHHPLIRHAVAHNEKTPEELKKKILDDLSLSFSEKDLSSWIDKVVYNDMVRY